MHSHLRYVRSLARRFSGAIPIRLATPLWLSTVVAALCIPSILVPGVEAQSRHGGADKAVEAVRVERGEIRVDGVLDEAVWSAAPGISDFLQKTPLEGAEPSERTEVYFAYDDAALYVGARMFSAGGPSAIQAPLGMRDVAGPAEFILISLDTFLDRRTAYSFGVTAAGIRIDRFHRTDSDSIFDNGFNPVWEARTTIDQEGWTAEMWIPLSQLRFTREGAQIWGLNVQRWIPSRNEDVYWSLVPSTEQAWASRFGRLTGIEVTSMPRRLEILPYLTGGSSVSGDRDPSNPFDDGRNLKAQLGGDIKFGLGPNLTLDATFNPDFGQVEADPAVVNLTGTEDFFDERRPFFSEGSALLVGPTVNYFYSRRLGARPSGPAAGDHVDYPENTTILGAAKVTGRLDSGTSIGVLGAVTADEFAQIADVSTGTIQRVRVAPRTSWAVGRVQQELGRYGSMVGLMMTGVLRDLDGGDPLSNRLVEQAYSANGEALLRFAEGTYQLSLSGGITHVSGSPGAVQRVQEASPRYFQRPDASHLRYDPMRTALTGFKTTLHAQKLNGRHWLGELFFDVESPALEFNDIGRLGTGDGISTRQGVTYRETRPGDLFRDYRVTATHASEWNFEGLHQYTRLGGSADVTWNNFWTSSLGFEYSARGQNWQWTRGGPSVGTPEGWSTNFAIGTRPSSEIRWNVVARLGRDEAGGSLASLQASTSFVPAPRWEISIGPSYEHLVDARQYVGTIEGGPEATYGRTYLFGHIDRTTLRLETRLSFTLSPDLDMTLYAEPFVSSGLYSRFGQLREPRSYSIWEFGVDGSTLHPTGEGGTEVRTPHGHFLIPANDFVVRSFRGTSVLRWEWRPGSSLYLVWQQDRSRSLHATEGATLDDMLRTMRTTGDHYFAVKLSYWLAT